MLQWMVQSSLTSVVLADLTRVDGDQQLRHESWQSPASQHARPGESWFEPRRGNSKVRGYFGDVGPSLSSHHLLPFLLPFLEVSIAGGHSAGVKKPLTMKLRPLGESNHVHSTIVLFAGARCWNNTSPVAGSWRKIAI